MPKSLPNPIRQRNAEASRRAILENAVAEFATQGVAGARTAAIAKAAHVNKALLYYYFEDKEALYRAVLDHVFSGLTREVLPMFESEMDPGRKVLRFARYHFEYLVQHPVYPRLIQHEMSREAETPSEEFRSISSTHFRPLYTALLSILHEGMRSREFRKIDPVNLAVSIIGMNVFYFISAPVARSLRGIDPFAPEHLKARVAAVLDTIAATLFADRQHGTRMAQAVAREFLAASAAHSSQETL